MRYLTINAWENASPDDDPNYWRLMYGPGGIYGPAIEPDEEENDS
jgi:hypothetical protein